MRILSHVVTRVCILAVVLVGAAAVSTDRAAADPDFTLDPMSPSLAAIPATGADVLRPVTGAPKWAGR